MRDTIKIWSRDKQSFVPSVGMFEALGGKVGVTWWVDASEDCE
jgi:hypothetical protein